MEFTINEVVSKKDRKAFVDFPLKLYKNVDPFVPPMYSSEMSIFTEKNVYSNICESCFYIAKDKDGNVIGRIHGIIQHQYNEIHNIKQARFTRFDSIENEEVSKALLDKVETRAKEKGCDSIVGPLGFSDLEREGLLIEGFEYLNTFEEQYNFPYYAELIEKAGYKKDVDWLEFRVTKSDQCMDTIYKLCERAKKSYNLKEVSSDLSMKEIINKYGNQIFEVLDICYSKLYGTVPFTKEMKEQMIDQFKLMLDSRYFSIIIDQNDEVIAFGFCLPGIGKAFKKSGGKLTLPTILRVLKAKKKPESVDMALVGILPEYRNSAVSAFIIKKLYEILEIPSVKYLETNLNLEYNTPIMALWKRFNSVQHKKRRCYIKHL